MISEAPSSEAVVGDPLSAQRLLGRAALGRDNVARAVSELRDGHAVVLVNLREIGASEPRAQLEQHARAA